MFILEEPVRFSRSRLWELQHQFYQGLGQAAWEDKLVPNTVSTNAFMALAYAKVLAAYLTDIAMGRLGDVDPTRPVHIVEIGAGTGKLGYLTTRFLAELTAPLAARKKGPLFRYVLTDGVAANVEAWRQHPRLQEIVEAGLMDIAQFDAAKDEGPVLAYLGEPLEVVNRGNPIALIANYAFDILPYDAFTIRDGRLFEHLVGLNLPEAPVGEIEGNGEILNSLSFVEDDRPISELPYYGNPLLDGLLSCYASEIPETLLTMPVGAITCLERLTAMGDERCLALVSDKARFSLQQFDKRTGLGLSLDGAYAATVNLEAIARTVAAWGGISLAREAPNPRFDSYAFLTAPNPNALNATKAAVQEQLQGFGPQAYYALLSNLRSQGAKAGLPALLAVLSLGKPDPAILFRLSETLLKMTADKVTPAQAKELLRLIRLSWDNRFDLREESNTAFALARLAKRMGDAGLAAFLYQASLDVGGPDASTRFNLALCRIELGETEAAKASLQAALELKPDFARAAQELARLES